MGLSPGSVDLHPVTVRWTSGKSVRCHASRCRRLSVDQVHDRSFDRRAGAVDRSVAGASRVAKFGAAGLRVPVIAGVPRPGVYPPGGYGCHPAKSSATIAVTSRTSDAKDAQVCPGSRASTRPHIGIVKSGWSFGSFIS
jgi:hypothetical protein